MNAKGVAMAFLFGGTLGITLSKAADSGRSYMADRAAGVSAAPVQSVPDRSLRSESISTTNVQKIAPTATSPRTIVQDGRRATQGARLAQRSHWSPGPDRRHSGIRYHYGGVIAVVPPGPEAVTNQKVKVESKTEYDDYGIGNTVRTQRVYTTTERQTTTPPSVTRIERPGQRNDVEIRQEGTRVTETEKRMDTISAERASLPGQGGYVRVIGSDGNVYLVPQSEADRVTLHN